MFNSEFTDKIIAASGQKIRLCYGCRKCTSGCPVACDMDYGPDWIIRMVNQGNSARLLASPDIWFCASCETCGARCPNGIETSRIIDALRQLQTVERGKTSDRTSVLFHRIFLGLLKVFGKIHEASLMGIFTLCTLKLATDLPTIFKLFIKGKAPLIPSSVKGKREIKRIYTLSQQQLKASIKQQEKAGGSLK